MSKIALSGPASGTATYTVTAPTGATDRTITLPDVSATLITDSAGVLNIGSGQIYKDASGNLGIGTSSPGAKLSVSDGTVTVVTSPYTAGSTGYFGTSTNHVLAFLTNNAERARIDTSGNLLVGTTSSSGRVTATVSSTQDIFAGNDGSSAQFAVTYNGVIFARNTTVQSLSDVRLKKNIVDSDYGLDIISALRPVRYDWKEGYGNPDQLGFIAQEVEQVFPRMLGEWKIKPDEDAYKTVGTSELIPVLVKAIQEQQAIITALTARVEALEGTQP